MTLYRTLLVLGAALAAATAYPTGLSLGALGGHGHSVAESYASLSLVHSLGHGQVLGSLGGGELGGGGGQKHEEEVIITAHPKYEFKYGVEDHHTGDHKDQKEERDGSEVKGEYSLLQPDGRKRTVHYSCSKHSGCNAIVSYSGHAIHPEVHGHGGHGL